MNAIQIFEARYLDLHSGVLATVTEGLGEEQLRMRPVEGVNPVSWILWHIARAEDVGVNRLVVDGTQVLDDSWHQRLGLRELSAGTGMTPERVQDLSRKVDLDALRAYLEAVHQQTRTVLAEIDPELLSEVLDEAHLERVMVGEGVLLPPAHGFLPLYTGKTRGWFLAHLGLAHSYYHLGQITVAKRLWESRGAPGPGST